jgi:uncharacterized membrane protein
MTFLKKTIVLIVFLTMLVSTLSFANSAQPRMNPDQSTIYFNPDSGIELKHEVLSILVDKDLWKVDYHVVYDFHNVTDEMIDTPIWFIADLLDQETFSIKINDNEIETEYLDVNPESISNWLFNSDDHYVTPWDQTQIEYVWSYGSRYSVIPVEEFNLQLEPGEMIQVTIEYEADSGYISDDDYFSKLRTALYYLSPASFYDGDASVDIYLSVPEGTMVGSNIPLDSVSELEYESLGVPIGGEDLYLTFLNEKDLFFGTNVRKNYYNALYIIIAILLVGLITFRKDPRWRKISIALIIMGLLGFLARPTYGMMFMIMIFGPFVLVILLIILGIYLYMNRKRERLK